MQSILFLCVAPYFPMSCFPDNNGHGKNVIRFEATVLPECLAKLGFERLPYKTHTLTEPLASNLDVKLKVYSIMKLRPHLPSNAVGVLRFAPSRMAHPIPNLDKFIITSRCIAAVHQVFPF